MSDKSYIVLSSSNGGGAQIPRRLIIHSLAEFIRDGVRDWWGPAYVDHIGLSAHYYVTPSGVVVQQRGDHQVAYHAKGNNLATIGVEFLVPGAYGYTRFLERIQTPYLTQPQYLAGVSLSRELHKRHNFEAVQQHSDVDPQRKKDPGPGFPWEEFKRDIEAP